MSTRASISNHPVHPMLVAIPIGLWIFSFVCDLLYIFYSQNPIWTVIALYSMAGGVVGALVAAIPGFIDYLGLTDPVVKRIATFHMALNLTAVLLFSLNVWLRIQSGEFSISYVVLSFMTLVAVGISGWLGGELVFVHGVGVDQVHSNNVTKVPLRKK